MRQHAASWFNVVRLWDVASGRELGQNLRGHGGVVKAVAFAPDGKTLASVGDSGEVILWDAASGRPRRELQARRPHAVAFSPDGRRLAAAGFASSFQVWDVATGREVFRLRRKEGPDSQDVVRCVAFSPDGRLLVSAHSVWASGILLPAHLALWDPATGKLLRELALHSASLASLSFAPDGATLALGTGDGTVRLWDLRAGREVLALRGHHGHAANSVAFSPDGRTLASGSADQTVRLWEVASGKEVFALRGHEGAVTTVAFSPDGRVVASGGGSDLYPTRARGDHKVRLWDVTSGQEVHQFRGHRTNVTSLSFSPDGTRLVCGLKDATALVWDVRTVARGPAARGPRLGREGLQELWSALGGADAGAAYQAIGALAAAPEQAVALLGPKLRPAAPVDAAQLRRLIADLDSGKFSVREAATKALRALGEEAEPFLEGALAKKPTLETRKRLEALLSAPRVARSPEQLRGLRAVQVLERIGSPEARRVLQGLSQGAPEARLTREGRASLERLAKRPASAP